LLGLGAVTVDVSYVILASLSVRLFLDYPRVMLGMGVGLMHLQDRTLAARRPHMRVEGPSELIGIEQNLKLRSHQILEFGLSK